MPPHTIGPTRPASQRTDATSNDANVKPEVAQTTGEKALAALYWSYDKATPIIDLVTGTNRPDTGAELAAARAAPLLTNSTGAPAMLGDVTVVANGLLNLESAPAILIRLAKYTKGPLILARSNPRGPDGLRLRPLTQLDGKPLPPDLQGKIWVIGNESPAIRPWTESGDLLAKQFEVLEKEFPQMKAATGLGHDSLRDTDLSLIGYSQGALAAMSARKKLDVQGKSDMVERTISVAGTLKGTPFGESGLLSTVLGWFDSEHATQALAENRPEFVEAERARQGLGAETLDLAYGTTVHGEDRSNVEPFFAVTGKKFDDGIEHDGVVTTPKQGDAKCVVVKSQPQTHLMTWNSWKTADALVHSLMMCGK